MAGEDTDRQFSSLVSDLFSGRGEPDDEEPSDAEDSDAEDNRKDPDPAPDVESPEDQDTPATDPTDDDDADPDVEEVDDQDEGEATDDAEPEPEDDDAEVEEVESEPDADEGDDETSDPEPDDDEDETFVVEIDGEEQEVTLDELRKGYLRQSDYTRKTQELSRREEEVQKALAERRELAREVSQHPQMSEFVSEHPEAWEYLLDAPDEARKYMANPQEFEKFKQDYELLQNNPRIAEAYLKSGEIDEYREQAQVEQTAKQAVAFANQLDAAIEQIAEHEEYADHVSEEDVQQVKEYVLELGGVDENASPEETLQGINRLANIFVTPDGSQLDMQLVIDRLDTIKQKRLREQEREVEEAEEHNEEVEAELEEQDERPPATPEGDGAAAEPETQPERSDFQEVLGAIRGD